MATSSFDLTQDEGILDALRQRERGFTLSREYYTSPVVFGLDVQRVFRTQWLYAAHECQLPNLGDYVTLEVAGESLILIRGHDHVVRAFFNVCRHRGARIVQDLCGKARTLLCPYHGWNFGLDGALKGAPGMSNQICRDEWSLYPAWCEVWEGFIYVNLSQTKPSIGIAQMLQTPTAELARFRLRNMKIAKAVIYDVPANWKLFMENYRECYHCKLAHPEFCATVPVDKVHEHRRQPSTRFADWNFTFSKYALREGAATQSVDGKLVSIPLGDFTADEPLAMHALNFYPGHAIVLGRDYAMVFSLLPLTATSSQLATYWFVHERAVEGKDYESNRVTEFWDVTHQQDIHLCTINQQGVASQRYVPGPYSAAEEDDIDHFLDFYVAAMEK